MVLRHKYLHVFRESAFDHKVDHSGLAPTWPSVGQLSTRDRTDNLLPKDRHKRFSNRYVIETQMFRAVQLSQALGLCFS